MHLNQPAAISFRKVVTKYLAWHPWYSWNDVHWNTTGLRNMGHAIGDWGCDDQGWLQGEGLIVWSRSYVQQGLLECAASFAGVWKQNCFKFVCARAWIGQVVTDCKVELITAVYSNRTRCRPVQLFGNMPPDSIATWSRSEKWKFSSYLNRPWPWFMLSAWLHHVQLQLSKGRESFSITCTFTDSSPKKHKEKQDTGSGLYQPCLNVSHYVNPRGVGVTNTISRAELAAKAATIIHNYSHIATDSLTSMHQIRKQLSHPNLHLHHIQGDVLQSIAKAIHQSPSPFISTKSNPTQVL